MKFFRCSWVIKINARAHCIGFSYWLPWS